jgi:hypothetical protein
MKKLKGAIRIRFEDVICKPFIHDSFQKKVPTVLTRTQNLTDNQP